MGSGALVQPLGVSYFLGLLMPFCLLGAPLSRAEPASPVEEETVSADTDDLVDRPDFVPGEPYYLHVPSRWAFGFRAAISGVPTASALGNTFQLIGEYMLPTGKIGYLSGGVHLGTFPLYAPSAQIPYPNYANSLLGAQIKFQLKFSQSAVIVPTVGLEYEFFQIKENDFDQNQLSGSDFGYSVGLMLNMGFIDRLTERDAHQSIGLTRAYLTLDLRSANLNTSLFTLSGNYWLIGFRMEVK